MNHKKIIFLDRDGVINKKPLRGEYVKNWQEFEFLPGAIEALEILNQNGYQIFIITNQAGIGRKIMTEENLELIHQNLKEELKRHNIKLGGIYYCPHEISENCQCRKPKPGLFFQAAREHNLDLRKVIFVGDEERDLLVGQAVGCRTILVEPEKNLLEIVNSLPY